MRKTITVRSLETLQDKLKPFNRKLARRSIPPITIVSSTVKTKKIMVGENAFLEPVFVTLHWFEVELDLAVENLGFQGTSLLGFIEVTSNGDLILHPMAEGAEPLLEQFRNSDIRCEHCNTARARKKTFVFLKDGKTLMIGKGCAEEYFGLDIAEILTEYIDYDPTGFSAESEEGWGAGGGRRAFDRQMFLAAALFWIKMKGFAPGKMGPGSTASMADDFTNEYRARSIMNGDDREMRDHLKRFLSEGKLLIEEIGEIFEYFGQLQTTDSFLLNCKAAILDEYYTRRGMLACAVNAFFKERYKELDAARRAEWEAKKADQAAAGALTTHYGKENERIEVAATLAETREMEPNDFGTVTLVKFFTDNGSELTWFTGSGLYNFEIGKRYLVRGTVKRHGEFRGVKQTQLGRCILKAIDAEGNAVIPAFRVANWSDSVNLVCPHCGGRKDVPEVKDNSTYWNQTQIENLFAEDNGEPHKCAHCKKAVALPQRDAFTFNGPTLVVPGQDGEIGF
jgi:DNA-directed RNA polymerase subunit RPC12/RpoP